MLLSSSPPNYFPSTCHPEPLCWSLLTVVHKKNNKLEDTEKTPYLKAKTQTKSNKCHKQFQNFLNGIDLIGNSKLKLSLRNVFPNLGTWKSNPIPLTVGMANKAQGPFYPTQIQQCQPNSENNITIHILQFQGFLSKQAEKSTQTH